MSKIRVLIVDDHTLMRAGLRSLLSGQKDIEVVGEAADGKDALKLAAMSLPNVILLDISMMEMNGLECLKALPEICPDAKVILLTMHEDSRYIKEGFALGAMGYILKKAADDVLYEAIRMVNAGEMYLHQSMTKTLVGELKGDRKPEYAPAKPLSEQEKRVLSLIAEGYSNREIAEQMLLSVKTVETYKYRIMEKLQCKKRSDLVKYATGRGMRDV
ncbi:MAG: response regulator transcription factor [Negativicutes bacterium]|nr:response regulator transcription factor [Negativicutes bacterium]